MRRLGLGVAVFGVAVLTALSLRPADGSAQAVPASERCVGCHMSLAEDELSAPARLFPEDVHAEIGFGCLSCHGPGGAGTLDASRGFLSAPTRTEVAEMCGRCHSDAAYMSQFNPSMRVDQVSAYRRSAHGVRLRETADPDVATCVDCHGAHRIRRASDPESSVYVLNLPDTCGRCHSDAALMQGRSIGVTQVEEHAGSVHGRMVFEEGDLTAPVCYDCHGSHGPAPDGLGSVRQACRQCHSVMADYFDASGHVSLFEEADLPLCATCHGSHAIAPADQASLGQTSAAVCRECHEANDPAGVTFEGIASVLDSLSSEALRGRSLLEEAERRGMEVSQALFELEEIGNAQTRARSAIHTFQIDPVRTEVEGGLEITNRAVGRAEEAFAEYDFRRLGLGVSSALMFLLIVGLLLRIRETEQEIDRLIEDIGDHFDRSLAYSSEEPGPVQVTRGACALLLEAAYASDDFDGVERERVLDVVRGRLRDGEVEAGDDALVELVHREAASLAHVGRFATLLGRSYDRSALHQVTLEFWHLVYSDAELARREVSFLDNLASLLRLGREPLAAVRREAGLAHVGGHRPTQE